MVENVKLTRLANRLRKLTVVERKRLARLLREPQPKTRKQTENERIDALEREFRAEFPDMPVDRELFKYVGTIPDEGLTLAEMVMQGYERSQRA